MAKVDKDQQKQKTAVASCLSQLRRRLLILSVSVSPHTVPKKVTEEQ